ncbi:MAG: hypothetical protein PVJ27_02735 [Candidatus Brocadiaceae bacterium]|jgi:hypothetical protein
MALSRRETLVAVVAVLAVALLLADRYIVTPTMESRAALEGERQRLMGELENGMRLFERRRLMARRWQEMTAGGLLADPSDAEGRVLQAVRDWAREAGLALSSVRPERGEEQGGVGEITVLAAGTGNMRAVSRFLWHAERTALPLRIRELQLGARTDGEDDLTLQLKLSTLYAAGGAVATGDRGGES